MHRLGKEHVNSKISGITAVLGVCTWILLTPQVKADAFSLRLPLDCNTANNCQIQNHFDHDPGPGFRDYACGWLGYDGHDGVDLRLPNLAAMNAGVAVRAAAAGRVRAVRDAMPDINVKHSGRAQIKGKEAGNAVAIRHTADWETQYSHLLRGSIRVKPGDQVSAGQVLGLVGLSGNTEFPHLHFEVRYRGRPVDPFVGLTPSSTCGPGLAPLWQPSALAALPYRPTDLIQSGFANRKPELQAIERGEYNISKMAVKSAALIFWVEVLGVHTGDQEWLQLIAPNGTLLAEKRGTHAKNRARQFSYIGKKRSQSVWPTGEYRAHYRLLRQVNGNFKAIIDQQQTILVE